MCHSILRKLINLVFCYFFSISVFGGGLAYDPEYSDENEKVDNTSSPLPMAAPSDNSDSCSAINSGSGSYDDGHDDSGRKGGFWGSSIFSSEVNVLPDWWLRVLSDSDSLNEMMKIGKPNYFDTIANLRSGQTMEVFVVHIPIRGQEGLSELDKLLNEVVELAEDEDELTGLMRSMMPDFDLSTTKNSDGSIDVKLIAKKIEAFDEKQRLKEELERFIDERKRQREVAEGATGGGEYSSDASGSLTVQEHKKRLTEIIAGTSWEMKYKCSRPHGTIVKNRSYNGEALLEGMYNLKNKCIDCCAALIKALNGNDQFKRTGFKAYLSLIKEAGQESVLYDDPSKIEIGCVANTILIFKHPDGTKLMFDPTIQATLRKINPEVMTGEESKEKIRWSLESQHLNTEDCFYSFPGGGYVGLDAGLIINGYIFHDSYSIDYAVDTLFNSMYGSNLNPD